LELRTSSISNSFSASITTGGGDEATVTVIATMRTRNLGTAGETGTGQGGDVVDSGTRDETDGSLQEAESDDEGMRMTTDDR